MLSGVQALLLHAEMHPAAKESQRKFFVKLIDGLISGRTFTQKRGLSNVPAGDVRFNRMLEHAPIKHDKPSKCARHKAS